MIDRKFCGCSRRITVRTTEYERELLEKISEETSLPMSFLLRLGFVALTDNPHLIMETMERHLHDDEIGRRCYSPGAPRHNLRLLNHYRARS